MKTRKQLRLYCVGMMFCCGCLLGGLVDQPQDETGSSGEEPNQFDYWAQGIPTYILINDGRQSLTNFREQFQMRLSGVDENGAPGEGLHEYLVEFDKAAGEQSEIQTIQSPSRYLSGTQEWATSGGYTYWVHAESAGGRICEKTELPADTSHYSDVTVTRALTSITPGELVEKNVWENGIAADIYEIDDVTLLFFKEVKKLSGKVWIAQKPMYFLKAEGEIEGVVEIENKLYTGKATFTYEVKDFDQVKVNLPVLCAYPPDEFIPLPPNAQEVQKSRTHIYYSSPDDWNLVKNYYLNTLADQGWNVEEVPSSAFEQILQASITTPQGIEIQMRIRLTDMSEGCRVGIIWQAR